MVYVLSDAGLETAQDILDTLVQGEAEFPPEPPRPASGVIMSDVGVLRIGVPGGMAW